MSLIVSLKAMGATAYLEGDAAATVTASGEMLGNFAMVLFGHASRSVGFGPQALHQAEAIQTTDGRWELTDLSSRVTFRWATRCYITDSADAAVTLGFATAELKNANKNNTTAVVALPDISASIIPDRAPDRANTFFYADTGVETREELVGRSWPELNERTGFYLKPGADGVVQASLGVLKNGINVSTRDDLSVAVSVLMELLFLRENSGPEAGAFSLKLEATRSGFQRVLLRTFGAAGKDTGLRFASAHNEPGMNIALAASCVVTGQALRLRNFLDRTGRKPMSRLEVRADAGDPAFEDPLGRSSIEGPQDRITFAMEIPKRADLSSGRVQVLYGSEAPQITEFEAAFGERFNGVRVRGVGDDRGLQARFDADCAILDLASGEDRFHLLAGAAINPREATQAPLIEMPQISGSTAVLTPKLNISSGARHLDIPVATAVLRVEKARANESPMTVDERGNLLQMGAPLLVSNPVGIASVQGEASEYAEWALALDPNYAGLTFDLTDEGLGKPRAAPAVVPTPAPLVEALVADAEKAVDAAAPQWVDKFRTQEPGVAYASAEDRNLLVKIDDQPVGRGTTPGEVTTVKTVKDPSGKERLAYTAFFVTLGYALVELIAFGVGRKWEAIGSEELKIGLKDLDKPVDPGKPEDFVRRNGLDDLLVTYNMPDGSETFGRQEFKRLIERNRPTKEHDRLLLPISKTVGLVLWDKDKDGQVRWMDQLVQRMLSPDGEPPVHPDTMLALDFSTQAGLAPGDIGRKPDGTPWTSWDDIPKDEEVLWPKARAKKQPAPGAAKKDKKGPLLDPSDPKWRGIFFRNAPASVLIPPFVDETLTAKFPAIAGLLETLQNKLLIRYGWRDPNGATFVASITERRRISPEVIERIAVLEVDQMGVKGAPLNGSSSAIVQAGGSVILTLPWWKAEGAGDDEAMEVTGTFQLDLTNKKDVLQSLRIRVNRDFNGPADIPGIDRIVLSDLDCDLKSATLAIDVFPDDKLKSVLPFLTKDKPLSASVYINLSNEQDAANSNINLLLPTEIETKLFGRWNLSVTHAAFVFEDGTQGNDIFLRFQGRIDLRLPGLRAIVAEITIRRRPGATDWEVDVTFQGIDIELEIGDTRIAGNLEWVRLPKDGTKPPEDGAVSQPEILKAGRDREIYGALSAKGGVFGEGWELLAKSGHQGGKTYFASLLQGDFDISLGSMEIQQPGLLLAHDADFEHKTFKLSEAFAEGNNDVIKQLRPDEWDDQKLNRRTWLTNWKPNDDMGTLVAVSGYLNTKSALAKPVDEKRYRTTVAYSDLGYFRVDAYANLFGLKDPQRFSLTINTKRKYIEAGFSFPEIKIAPHPAPNPQYIVSPGYFALGASYGGPFKLKQSMGWPVLTGEDDYERDWTRASRVKITGMWPINTFWGGVQTEVRLNPLVFYQGFAVRLGWTETFELTGSKLADARAELGVALGGVFEFEFSLSQRSSASLQSIEGMATPRHAVLHNDASLMLEATQASLRSVKADPSLAEHAECIDYCLQIMAEAGLRSTKIEARLSASIYADVWGSGSVEFLGVTIVSASLRAYVRFLACGSIRTGVRKLKGAAGFEFSVTILCVTYTTTARFEIVLKDEDCSFQAGERVGFEPVSLPAPLRFLEEVQK
ncbi:hypothetical protein [Pontivivens ytuae]|uniref:Uncharacterized protein n=1 Tax=Pontivivens ytuae TaxID=2789856 RepID=A0A7S9LVS9_9RHOB|nr:hypothetical protein [Pontivivens ytuae]QPH56029.1 hypothetical protein I0K15_10030 [Pontivivens ytuae]